MKTSARFTCVLLLAGLLSRAEAADFRPSVDPHRLINESMSLLREREPEMTEAEYAIYEKVVPMVRTQPALALKLLEDLAAKEEAGAAFDLVLGNLYYEQGRPAEAEARFNRALKKFPSFLRAWDNLGVLYYSTGRFAEAGACFSKAVALGGREARHFGLLGYCLAQSGNPVAAEMSFLQAGSIEPANPDWVEGLLGILLSTRQHVRAEGLLRQLVQLRPREGRYWLALANVLVAQSRELDATAALETAASLDVLPADGLPLLGDLYVDLKMYPDAVRAYGDLAAKNPAGGTGRLVQLVRALIETGDLAAAGAVLNRIESPPASAPSPVLWQARAEWLLARGELPGARTLFEKVLEQEPLNGRALLDLAKIHGDTGDEARAALALESALTMPEVAPAAALRLAQIKVRHRRYGEALAFLDRALAADKSPSLREYRERIRVLAEDRK